MIYLGYLGWKKTKSGEDYLLAGKNVKSWIIGLSYGSTFISTSAIVGFGGYAAIYGMGIIWLAALNITVGVLVAFVFFGKRVRKIGQRLKCQTFPELLGRSYNSEFIRWFVALVILIGMPLYAAAVLIGGAIFMSNTIPGLLFSDALLIFAIVTAIYVITGGLRAVMYTDALQGALMVIGMVVILAITITSLGGVESANQQLTDLAPQIPQSLRDQGMNGWTAFPSFLSENWFSVVATIILPVGIGVLAQPQLAVRFMTAKNAKTLNRAVPVGGIFLILMTGFAFTIGAWSNVYFWNNPDFHTISFLAAGKDIDSIIPLYINTSMDQTIVTMFMLTLLAAAMSTLSSLFHVMGSAAGYDLWATVKKAKFIPQKWKGEESAKTSLRINRYATIIMIVISLALALIMPKKGGVIAIATAMFFGVCASAFLPLFVHTLFAKRPSKSAARISLAVGTVTWFGWMLFVFAKDSTVFGLTKALFGTDSLLSKPWSIIDPIVIALPLSTIALLIVYYWEKRSRTEAAALAPST
jgi:SSS family solute:Na+ symporter